MKENKYHIYLSTEERNQIIASLVGLKNKLIEQGKYTDAVDDVLIKVVNSPVRKFKVKITEG